MSVWARAPRIPTTMVSNAATISGVFSVSPGKSSVSVRTIA